MKVIAERGLRCEHCGKKVSVAKELTLHHIIELTPENIHDAMIALNPENVLVVHNSCHNKIHKRSAGKIGQRAYIVYGPPLSGKSTYVHEHMKRGDIVVDFDLLFNSISTLEIYDKPDELLMNVKAVHSLLLDHIKTRFGKWQTAWVIGGYADKYKREKLTEDLGAEAIFMQATKEECLMRLEGDLKRRKHKEEWTKYIERWFEQYTK